MRKLKIIETSAHDDVNKAHTSQGPEIGLGDFCWSGGAKTSPLFFTKRVGFINENFSSLLIARKFSFWLQLTKLTENYKIVKNCQIFLVYFLDSPHPHFFGQGKLTPHIGIMVKTPKPI
jgi:hypothetical protein